MLSRRRLIQAMVVTGGDPFRGGGHRRLDQRTLSGSRAGSGPAATGNIFIGRLIVTGPNAGLFIYSPSPGAGNLVASITGQAGTDPYGNAYPAGVVLFGPGNARNVLGWSTFVGSIPLLALFPDASWAFTGNSPFIQSFDSNKGLATEFTALQMGSGNAPAKSPSEIILFGSSPDGTTSVPHVSIYGGAASVILADFNAVRSLLFTVNGASYGIAGSDADTTVTTITLNNDITKAWTVPANDWQVGTAYKITAWGHGTQANPATTLKMSVDGTAFASVAAATSAAGFAAAGAAFNWKSEAIIICVTTGAGGTAVVSCSTQIYSGVTSTALVGESTAQPLNTTALFTGQIRASFAAAASLTCDGSIFEKLGS